MANYCMLCGKKLGIFASYCEDIFTGNTANCICNDCMEKTNIILKKSEMKIPLKPEDFERFSEDGKKYIDEYLEADSVYEEEVEVIDPMDCDVGDAVISHTFEVDDEECAEILKQLHAMDTTEIEKFLDPLVSENDTADGFMTEIMTLDDDELDSVISDQREYYNNAEWAYVLFVKEVRTAAKEHTPLPIRTSEVAEIEDDKVDTQNADEAEIERLRNVFMQKTEEELKEIITDGDFTAEARIAAKQLLEENF